MDLSVLNRRPNLPSAKLDNPSKFVCLYYGGLYGIKKDWLFSNLLLYSITKVR